MTSSIGTVDRIRWMAALAAATVLTVVIAAALHGWQPPTLQAVSANPPAYGGSSAVLDPRIAALAVKHPEQELSAIVQFKAGVSAERARWAVSRVSGRVVGQLHIINALAVKLTAERAHRLAANPDVHAVSLNATIKTEGGPSHGRLGRPEGSATGTLQSTYDDTLGVTGLWRDNFDGAGVGVAVIDTGIDGNLPDFQAEGSAGSRVVASAVINPGAATASDSYGHGTDVAGIIGGDGNNLRPSDPLRGRYVGVAPDSNLVSIKVSDEKGNANVLDVIYGLQFAVDHKTDYNIRVVNLSLDSQTPQSYKTDPLDAAAEAAWMHGIVVVAAAGNRGDDSDAVQYAPANDPYVITVGAVNENATTTTVDDFIAPWSSRGVTQDGFQKPDLYAPGAHIVSVLAPNSAFASICPACTLGGEYIRTSGTSMAAPMISGLVADLLEAHPRWTPDVVKGALTNRFVSSNAALQEADAAKVVALPWAFPANRGLTPNQLIDPTTGDIDYTRSSWSRSSWSTATGSLSAGFARSSWSCNCASAASASGGDGSQDDEVDSSRSSWSRSSWSTHFDPTSANG